MPLISVCIANYNGQDLLPACLDSVFSQDWGQRIEVIVYDDASTDGSLALLESYGDRLITLFGYTNVGFCVANNRMAQRASGDYLLLLNNDAELLPGALDALIAGASARGSDAILTLRQFYAQNDQLIDSGCLLDPFYNPVPNLDGELVEVAMGIGACLFLGKGLWNRLGGFPEWFGSIGEDLYLCCAARLSGAPVIVVPSSGYRHWGGKSFGGTADTSAPLRSTFRRRSLSESNKTAVMLALTPWPLLLPLLLCHGATLLLEASVVAVTNRAVLPVLRLYGRIPLFIWKNRAALWALRQKTQAERRIGWRDYYRPFILMPHKLSTLLRRGVPRLR